MGHDQETGHPGQFFVPSCREGGGRSGLDLKVISYSAIREPGQIETRWRRRWRVETRWIDKQYAEEFQLVPLPVQETQYIFPLKASSNTQHCSFKTWQLVHRVSSLSSRLVFTDHRFYLPFWSVPLLTLDILAIQRCKKGKIKQIYLCYSFQSGANC